MTTDVTIEVFPSNAAFSDEFVAALTGTLQQRPPTLNYRGTVFHLTYAPCGNGIKEIKTVLTGLDAPLPAVFADELRVNHVVLRSSVPSQLLAKTGWYVGENFGLPGGACCIDPQGQTNLGTPRIYANGSNYNSVVSLFRRVMAGGMEPGHNGDIWSGKIRR
jgi:hypothetical protein